MPKLQTWDDEEEIVGENPITEEGDEENEAESDENSLKGGTPALSEENPDEKQKSAVLSQASVASSQVVARKRRQVAS